MLNITRLSTLAYFANVTHVRHLVPWPEWHQIFSTADVMTSESVDLVDAVLCAVVMVMCARVLLWGAWSLGGWLLVQWLHWFCTMGSLVLFIFCFTLLYCDLEKVCALLMATCV